MRTMRRYGLVTIVLVAVLAAGVIAAPPVLEVKASLIGVVLEEGLVTEGTEVTDGQPLVYVRTATRSMAVAATAPRDGVVTAVLVRPGQRLERGQVIVRLMPK